MEEKILQTAYKLACKQGYRNIRKREIARLADVAEGSVSYHYGVMGNLQTAVLMRGITNRNLTLLAPAFVDRHPVVLSASKELLDSLRAHIVAY